MIYASTLNTEASHSFIEIQLVVAETGFIQGSMSKFKDFSRTSKSLSNSFKDLKIMKNTDITVKILLQKC